MEAETAQTVETEGATPVAPAPAAENFVPSTEPERSGAPSADDGYDKTQELFVSGLSWHTHELDLARHIEKVAAVFVAFPVTPFPARAHTNNALAYHLLCCRAAHPRFLPLLFMPVMFARSPTGSA